MPVKFNTLATQITFWGLDSSPPNYGFDATISILYIFFTLILVAIYISFTRKSFRFSVIGGKGLLTTAIKSTQMAVSRVGRLSRDFSLVMVLPLAALLFLSFTRYFTIANGHIFVSYWLGNWSQALAFPALVKSIYTSIEFGLAGGLLSTVLALFLSYAFLKPTSRGARILEYISYMPLVIPGIVYSLAIFWMFLFLPGVSGVLFGTIWPMVIAVTFIFLPKSVRIISGNMIQISNRAGRKRPSYRFRLVANILENCHSAT